MRRETRWRHWKRASGVCWTSKAVRAGLLGEASSTPRDPRGPSASVDTEVVLKSDAGGRSWAWGCTRGALAAPRLGHTPWRPCAFPLPAPRLRSAPGRRGPGRGGPGRGAPFTSEAELVEH